MDEIINQFFAYLHGLWRYRWSALLIAWIVAIAGWITVYALPDHYATKTVIYIDTESIMKPLLKGLTVESDSTDELAVMTRMLLSRDNLLAVMRETDMDLEADTPAQKERMVEKLAASITLKGDADRKSRFTPRTNIFEIGYDSDSPERAYQVVSKLLNTLIENTLNSGRTDTLMAQKFLDRQIREYEDRLSAAEQRLATFKKENVGLMPSEKGGYFQRLQHSIDQMEETRSNLELARLRQVELEKQIKGESEVLDAGSYDEYAAQKMRTYQEQLALLKSQYTASHPDVLALEATIRDLKKYGVPSLGTPSDDSQGAYNPVYQELKVQESQARLAVGALQMQLAEQEKVVEHLKESVDAIPQVEARLAKLNRDYEITRQRYLNLVERRESARLAQEAGQSSSDINFRVIEPPVVPISPSGPNRPLLLIGVLVVALGAGVGWMILRFLLHPTYVDYKQLRNKVDFPILGSVSLYMTPQHRRKRRMQLASFLLAAIMLLGGFGGAMYYNKQGTRLVKTFMSGHGIQL